MRSYLAYWLARHPKRRPDAGKPMSINTIRGYQRHIDKLCSVVGDAPLTKLTARDLDAAYDQLLASGGFAKKADENGHRSPRPLEARTVLHIHRCVSTALAQAVKWSILPDNPATRATPPQPGKSKARALTLDERNRILEAARKARYPGLDVVVSLLGLTGLRRSELLALSWSDLDLDTPPGWLTVRRTVAVDDTGKVVLRSYAKTEGSVRTIPLSTGLLGLLRRHKAFIAGQAMAFGADYQREPMLVFPEAGGFAMHPEAMSSKLRSLMRTAGVKGVQPTHGHRHSMATHMLAAGADLKTVSTRLGHSSTQITHDLYVHVLDEKATAAAEALEKAFGGE